MMSSDEMYALGVHDAEQDTPNFFYYQHYYHYRRGYDQTRRRQSGSMQLLFRFWPILLGVLLGSILLGGGYWLLQSVHSGDTLFSWREPETPTPIIETATPTPTLTPTPIPPTPTPEPTIVVGGAVVVTNVGDAPLRGRRDPGMTAPAQVGFPQGSRLKVLDGPVEQDGYRWWKVEGTQGIGWCAERSPDEIIWLEPVVPE